jgi:hypothetical protein
MNRGLDCRHDDSEIKTAVVHERTVQVMSKNVDSVATKISELLSTLTDEEALELSKRLREVMVRRDGPASTLGPQTTNWSSDSLSKYGGLGVTTAIAAIPFIPAAVVVGSMAVAAAASAAGGLRSYRMPDFTERLKEAFRLAKLKALTESPVERTDGG